VQLEVGSRTRASAATHGPRAGVSGPDLRVAIDASLPFIGKAACELHVGLGTSQEAADVESLAGVPALEKLSVRHESGAITLRMLARVRLPSTD